jgi:DNA modification methylase
MANQTRVTPAMANRIEIWPVDRLVPYARNARTHSPEQVAQIAASIVEVGFNAPILVDSHAGIIAGHGRMLAARKLGLAEVPVVVLDHLSDTQRRAYILADNKLAENAGWDEKVLAAELADLERDGLDLKLAGFSDQELEVLLADSGDGAAPEDEEQIPDAPADPVTRPGDVWLIGCHRVVCGDCRDRSVVARLFDGGKANLVVTSPPYATQREYDPASGFKPIPPEKYVGWYRAVADAIAAILGPKGSYFLNIKPHADDGERSLYVMDLVLAHKRKWGWRFVDEFCWRKTDNGVPGGWNNRFKNAFEPVYHFCRQPKIKFHPEAVGHVSEDCFDYAQSNAKSRSGSGLLGCGARGPAAGKHTNADANGHFKGIARPSNVIECKAEGSQGSHSAPFPRALVEFFVLAFTDAGDIVFDPFLGSGTSIAAAHVHGRVGYGSELSPAYCDVALHRLANLIGEEPALAETGQAMAEVATARDVPLDQADDPHARDSRRTQHRGSAPANGRRSKAS